MDDPALLRQYLATRDVPCPHCLYNLRNLHNDICPECGEHVTLRVQPMEPRQAAAIAGLVLLSAAGGMNGLLLIYWLAVFNGRGRGLERFVIINAVGFAVIGSLTALWLIFWRKIRRLSAVQRWLLVGACAGAAALDLICFIRYIR